MQFQLNGTNYRVEQDHKGKWFWINIDKDFESHGTFDFAYEAQQDAIIYVQNEVADLEAALEDKIYGSYDDQVRSLHDYLIRH